MKIIEYSKKNRPSFHRTVSSTAYFSIRAKLNNRKEKIKTAIYYDVVNLARRLRWRHH